MRGLTLLTEATVVPLADSGYAVSYIDTFNYSSSLVVQRFGADGAFLVPATPRNMAGFRSAVAKQSSVALPTAVSWRAGSEPTTDRRRCIRGNSTVRGRR